MNLLTLREFFLWNTVINFGLLIFSFVMVMSVRKWAYKIHGTIFNLTDAEFDVIWYTALAAYKLGFFVFNVVPYAALCIMTR